MLTPEIAEKILQHLSRAIEPELTDEGAEYVNPLSDEWQDEAKQLLEEAQ
jgi:hypothetical protein